MLIYHLYKPDFDGAETKDYFETKELALEYGRTFFPNYYILPIDEIPEDKKHDFNLFVLRLEEIEVKTKKPEAYVNFTITFNSNKNDFTISSEIITENIFKKYNYTDQITKTFASIFEKVDNLNDLEKKEEELLSNFKESFKYPLCVMSLTNKGYLDYNALTNENEYTFVFKSTYLYLNKENTIICSEKVLDDDSLILLNKIDQDGDIDIYIGFYIDKNTKEKIFSFNSFICEITPEIKEIEIFI